MENYTEQDKQYMARCLQLASLGKGNVSPNPMVGSVIVCDGRIIGEGYHEKYGDVHAEVNAISSVRDTSLLSRSTLYVSLEPCSHYGKTPPCSDLIISKNIPRVVVGVLDPYPEVSGRGVTKMRAAGIEVTVGVMQDECVRLNLPFMIRHTQNRPFVLLKWAQSADGFIDGVRRNDNVPVKLSNEITQTMVHRRRANVDAILVGTKTAEKDDPSLTVRYWMGRNPLRLVIDRELKLSQNLQLFSDGNKTVVYTGIYHESTPAVQYVQLDFTHPLLPQILSDLAVRKIQTLLVEGGANLLQQFIDAGLWDEAVVELAPVYLYEGVNAPQLNVEPEKRFEIEKNRFMCRYSNLRQTRQVEKNLLVENS